MGRWSLVGLAARRTACALHGGQRTAHFPSVTPYRNLGNARPLPQLQLSPQPPVRAPHAPVNSMMTLPRPRGGGASGGPGRGMCTCGAGGRGTSSGSG